jgi:hypothetical protein
MSDEKTEAQEALQAALERHVQAFRSSLDPNVQVTGDWILVAGVVSIDLDTEERGYAYHLAFSGGEQPEHIALGLLEMGKRLISEGEAS